MQRFIFYALLTLACMAFVLACVVGYALASEAMPGHSLGQPDHVYVVGPREPVSPDGDIDLDGRIPEYLVCGTRYLGDYAYDPNTGQGAIRYNTCAIRRQRHSVAVFRETIAHERSHARGFEHKESTPRRNPAYWP